MSIRALSWISEKLGIDVTGDPAAEQQQQKQRSVFDKVGEAIFGQTEDELPSDSGWGYSWNADTNRYEPTQDAPAHIKQEFDDRMRELTEPKKEVAPPPMLGADYVFHMQRAAAGPKYADHFNAYQNHQHQHQMQHSGVGVPALDPTLTGAGGANQGYQGLPAAISPHASGVPSAGGQVGGHGAIQIPSLVSEAPASNLVHFTAPVPAQQPAVQWGAPASAPPMMQQWGAPAASIPSLGVVNAIPTAPATLQ